MTACSARAKSFAPLVLTFALAASASAQELSELSIPPGGNGVSQRSEVAQWIGPVKVTIRYCGPAVHRGATDRTGHIWGELVQYGMFDEGFGPSTATPWRAGANESTSITFSHAVRVEGKDLSAGTYALFLELDDKGPWTWILSRHLGWGSYQYDAKDDALRVSVKPEEAPFTEFLTYGFDARKLDSAVAYLQWERKRVPMRVEVPDVYGVYAVEMRRELEGWPGFRWQNWQQAAQFCADHKVNLEEALVWADRAIKEPFRGAVIGHEDFSTLETKAAVLDALGRATEADVVMATAMKLPGTSAFELYLYGARKLAAGKSAEALEILRQNAERHPEEKFWTHLGLGRAYAALGDKSRAARHLESALANMPPSQKGSLPRLRQLLADQKS